MSGSAAPAPRASGLSLFTAWLPLACGALVGGAWGVTLVNTGYPGFGVAAAAALTVLGAALALGCLGRGLLRGLAGALGLLYAAALYTPLVPATLAQLTKVQLPQRADAIAVLGGGLDCSAGTMQAASAARLSRGVDLWRAGYADTLVFSAQSDALSPAACPRLSAVQTAALHRWFASPPRLLTLPQVANTKDEAQAASRLAQAEGWQRLLLVTSPSHSRRAAALFRRTFAQAGLPTEVVSVPAEEWRFSLGGAAYDRLQGLNVVLYEWLSRLKAAVYR